MTDPTRGLIAQDEDYRERPDIDKLALADALREWAKIVPREGGNGAIIGMLMEQAATALREQQQRIAELKAVLMTESEKRDLLSKEHYKARIAKLEKQLKAERASPSRLFW